MLQSDITQTIDHIQICLISASDKIESLENHNFRTRHSKNLVQCSFSSSSNSLETHSFYLFIFDFLKGFYSIFFDFSTIFIFCVTRMTLCCRSLNSS